MIRKNTTKFTSSDCEQRDVLLTVRDVAELDQCSEKTVRRAIKAGLLRVVRIGANSRLVRIRKIDHVAYRYECEVGH
ncbi:MAG: helix-turn-helix domain-containing protein [Parasphingorhabdus sp.]